MKVKRTLVVAAIALFAAVFSLSGISYAADAAYDGPKYKLSLGHVIADKTPLDMGARHFADLVSEKSGGKITVNVYSNSALGDNRSMIESLQRGTLDFCLPAVANLAAFTSSTKLFDLPFLFNNNKHAETVLDGEIGQNILKALGDKGLVGLSWWVQGWRELSTKNKPVHHPGDMSGQKIRVQDNEIHIAFWDELGASSTTMAYSELFTALQQGVVDAQENPVSNIKLSGFGEVQGYIIKTDHIYDPVPLIISKKTWEKLDPAAQAIIQEAAVEAGRYERDFCYKYDEDILKEYEAAGKVTVIYLTDDEKAEFRKAAQPVYDKYADEIGKDVIAKVQELGK